MAFEGPIRKCYFTIFTKWSLRLLYLFLSSHKDPYRFDLATAFELEPGYIHNLCHLSNQGSLLNLSTLTIIIRIKKSLIFNYFLGSFLVWNPVKVKQLWLCVHSESADFALLSVQHLLAYKKQTKFKNPPQVSYGLKDWKTWNKYIFTLFCNPFQMHGLNDIQCSENPVYVFLFWEILRPQS